MNAFLAELSRKLAERWITLLVLPGLLFVGALATALTLRQRNWHDVNQLVDAGRRLSADLDARGPVAVGLALAVVLLLSAAAGLAARGVAAAIQPLWLGQWPPPHRAPARPLVHRRLARWQELQDRYAALVTAAAPDPESAEIVAAARNRISLSRPRRATWMGDRIAASEARVRGQYRLDLYSTWPRLWLVLPDAPRAELRLARERLQETVTIAAWGVLYLAAGALWWPSAVLGAGLLLVGWRTSRVAVDGLAELVEAAVDVHGRGLAVELGVVADGPGELTTETGSRVTRILRKGA